MRPRAETSSHNAVSCYVTEQTSLYKSALCAPFVIEPRRTEMLEPASDEIHIPCPAHSDRRLGTTEPALIVELMVLITFHLRTDPVTVGHIHSCLQRHVPHKRGTHPGCVLKPYILKSHILNRTVERTLHIEKCLNGRNHCVCDSLSGIRIVIQLSGADVVIPFSRSVEKLFGIGEIECRIMSVGSNHRTRPRMLKLYAALRIMEPYSWT